MARIVGDTPSRHELPHCAYHRTASSHCKACADAPWDYGIDHRAEAEETAEIEGYGPR
jgi:hypothetical protein